MCGTKATVALRGTMPKDWYAYYFVPGDSRSCSYECLQALKEMRMGIEWKRKKQFLDGDTCGIKGCSRKAGGYLLITEVGTANPTGAVRYGPACEKCCQQYMKKKPDTLKHIWQQRQGLEDMAMVFNLPVEVMQERLTAAGISTEPQQTIVEAEGESVEVVEEPLLDRVTVYLPPKGPIIKEQKEAEELLALVRVFQITNAADLEMAAGVVKQANEAVKRLTAARTEDKKDAAKVVSDIEELYRPAIQYFEEIEQTLKGKIGQAQEYASHVQQQELQRAAMAAQAGDMATASQAQLAAASSEFTLPPGLQSADVLDFEVVNPMQIPRQYLTEDKKKIRAAIKAGERSIPGVHIFKKVQIKVKS